jgi:hypothetical protein
MLGMVVDVQILSFISTSGIQKMLGMVVDVQILSFDVWNATSGDKG